MNQGIKDESLEREKSRRWKYGSVFITEGWGGPFQPLLHGQGYINQVLATVYTPQVDDSLLLEWKIWHNG